MLRELFDDWDNDAIWSELSRDFIAGKQRKTDLLKRKEKKNLHLSLDACSCVPLPFKAKQSCSCQSELHPVHRFVTGGTFVTMPLPAEQPFHAPA